MADRLRQTRGAWKAHTRLHVSILEVSVIREKFRDGFTCFGAAGQNKIILYQPQGKDFEGAPPADIRRRLEEAAAALAATLNALEDNTQPEPDNNRKQKPSSSSDSLSEPSDYLEGGPRLQVEF